MFPKPTPHRHLIDNRSFRTATLDAHSQFLIQLQIYKSSSQKPSVPLRLSNIIRSLGLRLLNPPDTGGSEYQVATC